MPINNGNVVGKKKNIIMWLCNIFLFSFVKERARERLVLETHPQTPTLFRHSLCSQQAGVKMVELRNSYVTWVQIQEGPLHNSLVCFSFPLQNPHCLITAVCVIPEPGNYCNSLQVSWWGLDTHNSDLTHDSICVVKIKHSNVPQPVTD